MDDPELFAQTYQPSIMVLMDGVTPQTALAHYAHQGKHFLNSDHDAFRSTPNEKVAGNLRLFLGGASADDALRPTPTYIAGYALPWLGVLGSSFPTDGKTVIEIFNVVTKEEPNAAWEKEFGYLSLLLRQFAMVHTKPKVGASPIPGEIQVCRVGTLSTCHVLCLSSA